MADLTEEQASQSVKLSGSDLTGVETHYAAVDTSGNLNVVDKADGPVAPGTVATSSILIGGQFNSSLPSLTNGQQAAIQVDSSGRLLITASFIDSTKQSYSSSGNAFVCAAAATDVFTITGSATKTVKITRIEISGTTTAGSGATVSCALIKRSSGDTAGTPVSDLIVPYDSNNAAGTATVTHYTANPTVGTRLGDLRADRLSIVPVGNVQAYLIWDFGNRPSQAPTLRGTSQQLAINFGGATITAPVISISIEWTEE